MIDLSRLQTVLTDEVQLLEKMVDIEEKMMQILIEGDARALQGLNLYKEELVENMKELEEQRRALFSPGFTLKELCRGESSSAAAELEKLRRRILQLHASLQRKLKINRNLLRHNLQFVEYASSMIFSQNDELLYASSGKVEEKAPFSTGLLDSSV
jgi:flagellar biosynthesis/type III secretory pathway chaperone